MNRRVQTKIRNNRCFNSSFTLVETLVALLVVVCVFMGLDCLSDWARQSLNKTRRPSRETSFQISLSQLAAQGYRVRTVQKDRIILSNGTDSEQKVLRAADGQLIITGRRSGRMVLLGDAWNLQVIKHRSYQTLRLKTKDGVELRGELLLGICEEGEENDA